MSDDSTVDVVETSSRTEMILFWITCVTVAVCMIAITWFAANVWRHPLLGEHAGW